MSSHDVVVNNGVPTIQPGAGITKEAYAKMMMLAAVASDVSPYSWTAENTIVTSPRLHAWWTPAQVRWMHFQSTEIKCTKQAHNPALLWVAVDKQLFVFALKESIRPGPDTALFQPPLYNVAEHGSVCLGTMLPSKSGDTQEWVNLFYGSTFTHTNGVNLKLTKHPEGNVALWNELLEDSTREFPVQYLKPLNTTVEAVIQKLSNA